MSLECNPLNWEVKAKQQICYGNEWESGPTRWSDSGCHAITVSIIYLCVCVRASTFVCVGMGAKVFTLTNRELCYFFTAETLPQFSSAMLMFTSQAELECLAVGLTDISRKYNYYWNSNYYYFLYLTQYNVYELRSCLFFSLPADFLYSLFSVAWSWKNIEVLSTVCQAISPTNDVDGWSLFSEWI